MKTIPVGTRHSENIFATGEHLASAMGNHAVDVVATTALILFFEEVSHNLVLPYFETDEVSVGTHVNIDHLGPAFASESIQVTATLTSQQGRRLEFELDAKQNDREVMCGVHHRAVVARSKFEKKDEPADVIQKSKEIDFWFDFHSPWCYFASFRISKIAHQFGCTVNWRPVHLANLIQSIDGRRPLEANDNFVKWYQQDQYDTAKMMGLSFSPYKNYPARPSRALRAAIFANEHDLAAPFVQAVMQGYWSEQCDISDVDWLQAIATEVGLIGSSILEVVTNDSYKAALNQHLHNAIDQQLFGLPAVVVNGKVFWGNDRLDLLEHYLSSQAPLLDDDGLQSIT